MPVYVCMSKVVCLLVMRYWLCKPIKNSFAVPLTLMSVRIKKVLTAQAEAEKIRCIGEAEAASIEAVGKAEAEKMRLKAEAYQQYGDAAKTALVLEALPKVCDTDLKTVPFVDFCLVFFVCLFFTVSTP